MPTVCIKTACLYGTLSFPCLTVVWKQHFCYGLNPSRSAKEECFENSNQDDKRHAVQKASSVVQSLMTLFAIFFVRWSFRQIVSFCEMVLQNPLCKWAPLSGFVLYRSFLSLASGSEVLSIIHRQSSVIKKKTVELFRILEIFYTSWKYELKRRWFQRKMAASSFLSLPSF